MGEDTSAHTIAREGLAALWFHLMRCKRAAAAMVASPGQWRSQMKSTDKAGQSTMEKRRNVIAIIDDDSGMRDSLEDLLSVFGYRAEVHSSAEEFAAAAITTKAASRYRYPARRYFRRRIGQPSVCNWLSLPNHIHDGIYRRNTPPASSGSWLHRL